MPGPPSAGPETAPLHRNRDFVLLWTSQTLSSVGTRASGIAFPLLVLTVTGSAAQAGAVGFAQTLPFAIWFLPAGAIVDRFDRRRIMLAAESIRAAAMLSLAVALVAGEFRLWHVLLVGFIEGTGFVFFELGEAAALPHLVPERQLPTALAQNQARQQAAELGGQPLGGLLFAIGRSVPFAVDALSYVVSFVAVALIRPDFQDDRRPTPAPIVADLTRGVRWLWHQPFLRALAALGAAANFVTSALVIIVVVKTRALGGSPAVVGLVMAAFGVGSLLGSALAPAIQRRFGGRRIVVGTVATMAVSVAVLIPANTPLLVGVAFGGGAVASPAFNVMIGRYRYGLTPDELQGRVTSAFRVVAWSAIPLGPVAAGIGTERLGLAATTSGLAVILTVAALAALALPGLRHDPLPLAATGSGAAPRRVEGSRRARGRPLRSRTRR